MVRAGEPDDRARPRLRRSSPVDPGGLTRAPQPVPPSAWILPDPELADEDGVVGVGADLSPGTLVEAYRSGIFPWPHTGVPLPWFSPDPRGVLYADDLRLSRSLRQRMRNAGWHATVDAAFDRVIAGCAQERGDEGTWITPSMTRAYRRLHELGWVRSIEIWDGDDLVGGLYGIQVGGVFTGESMFHDVRDASKVALVELTHRFAEAGGAFVDVQVLTPHLAGLGAVAVPRDRYLEELVDVRDDDVRMRTARLPVSRLATTHV
jgi:leucyl/phenylalanyl-tRNA--protein transferase